MRCNSGRNPLFNFGALEKKGSEISDDENIKKFENLICKFRKI